jgi:DNA-binding HxlR family transcriptional regulator
MLVSVRNHLHEDRVSHQESTFRKPGIHEETTACEPISRMLARISDKWTLLVVRALGGGPLRFNALKREIGEVSQKMLASTLRDLEENGFVTRTVTPVTPPQVEYALTGLGHDFWQPVQALADWTHANSPRIDAARAAYAARRAAP